MASETESAEPSLRRFDAALWRDAKAFLAESLWFDADEGDAGAMRWCDIDAGVLHTSPLDGAADGSDDRLVPLPAPLASFHPVRGGTGMVAALGDRVVLVDEAGGIPRTVARIEHAHDGMRLNEGKCDPFGAFVVGSVDQDDTADAAIYRVTGDGRVEVLVEGIGTSNGFEWDGDGRTFWYTDTDVPAVYRAEYRPAGDTTATGPAVANATVVFDAGPSDGLTRDRDGGFWGALYGEGRVVRWTGEGVIDTEVRVPVPNVTSVAFGGPGLSTLYIATARENLDESQLRQFPESGGIFAVELGDAGVAGLPPHDFDDRAIHAGAADA